jgi:hypothetical protein
VPRTTRSTLRALATAIACVGLGVGGRLWALRELDTRDRAEASVELQAAIRTLNAGKSSPDAPLRSLRLYQTPADAREGIVIAPDSSGTLRATALRAAPEGAAHVYEQLSLIHPRTHRIGGEQALNLMFLACGVLGLALGLARRGRPHGDGPQGPAWSPSHNPTEPAHSVAPGLERPRAALEIRRMEGLLAQVGEGLLLVDRSGRVAEAAMARLRDQLGDPQDRRVSEFFFRNPHESLELELALEQVWEGQLPDALALDQLPPSVLRGSRRYGLTWKRLHDWEGGERILVLIRDLSQEAERALAVDNAAERERLRVRACEDPGAVRALFTLGESILELAERGDGGDLASPIEELARRAHQLGLKRLQASVDELVRSRSSQGPSPRALHGLRSTWAATAANLEDILMGEKVLWNAEWAATESSWKPSRDRRGTATPLEVPSKGVDYRLQQVAALAARGATRAGLNLQVQVHAPPSSLPSRFDPLFFQLADVLRERFAEARNPSLPRQASPHDPSNQATFVDVTTSPGHVRELVHLRLRAQLEPARFVLDIEDDSPREPAGFEALRAIIQEMGGELSIQHWPGQGVRAGLRVPLRAAASAA